LITDNKGVIIFVNPAFEKICGYTSKEVIGKTPGFLSSKLHKASFYKSIWKEIRAGNVFKDTFINKRKDGSLYYLEQVITPVKDSMGKVKYFVSTGRDTTNQRIAQVSLETSERQKQAILDTVPDLIFLINMEGKILNVYGNISEFKVTPDLIKNKLISDLLPKPQAVIHPKSNQEGGHNRKPSVFEYRFGSEVKTPRLL
jgi:PAS domain S-box-containing protein